MAFKFSGLKDQLKDFYEKHFKPLSIGKKLLWILVAISVIVGLWVLLAINASPHYVALVSNVSEESAGYIAQKLDSLNIPYKAGKNGTIYIPSSENVYNVRMKLATLGVLGPNAGTKGYGLLGNGSLASMGMTSFDRQVNFQIALAGELERSIDMIDAVQYSRVFLALPKYTYYVPGEEQKPTASVLVVLKPSMTLTSEQVMGIMNLVAGAVGNMSLKDVKVVDQYSNVLSDEVNLASSAISGASKLKLKQSVEKYYTQKVKDMLYKVFGYGNIAVAANVVLDWQKITQESKVFTPTDSKNNTGVLASQQEENGLSTNGAPVGAAGVNSNIPPTYASTSPSSQISTYSKSVRNYEVSQTYNQIIEDKSGEIKDLKMTVFLNSTTVKDENTIKNAVANSIGVDASEVRVIPMLFDRSAINAAERAEAKIESERRFKSLVIYSILLSVLMTIGFYYMRMKSKKKKRLKEIEEKRKKIEEEVLEMTKKAKGTPEEEVLLNLKKEALKWVEEDPAEVANIIKIWMSKD
jgi:flagellar M-ring protein FliF